MSADGVAAPYGGVMPNSTTRGGPSGGMTRYSGPKFPCTRPAWCTEASPVAIPMATASSSWPCLTPSVRMTSSSDGPGTYSLTR
jgi:hypothetical protein